MMRVRCKPGFMRIGALLLVTGCVVVQAGQKDGDAWRFADRAREGRHEVGEVRREFRHDARHETRELRRDSGYMHRYRQPWHFYHESAGSRHHDYYRQRGYFGGYRGWESRRYASVSRYPGYRYRHYQGHHYYYNHDEVYFPRYGRIRHGHFHSRYCPHWHVEAFASMRVLGAIWNDG